jgi:hypothetical protein
LYSFMVHGSSPSLDRTGVPGQRNVNRQRN